MYDGLEQCTRKIFSASKFIDYFVHDMLDYSILNRENENFTKNFVKFDLKSALEEIVEMLQDKIEMKNIKIENSYKGFESSEIVSDMRRI